MADDAKHSNGAMDRRRRVAMIPILIVDEGFIAWGVMAAAFLDRLLGPGGKSILPAGYEGFSKGSWSELVKTAPMAAQAAPFRAVGRPRVASAMAASP
jgi:hypothetical protein